MGGLIAVSTAMVRSIASGCLGALVGFLCHGAAGLIGLVAAAVLSNIYESCIENCGDYHVTVLLVILVTAHVIALMATIAIVRRILRNIGQLD